MGWLEKCAFLSFTVAILTFIQPHSSVFDSMQWLCRADWQKGLAYNIDRFYGPLLNIGPGGAILLPKSVHDEQRSTTAKTPVVLLRWALSFWKGYVNIFLFEGFLGTIRPKPFQNICISTITENYGFHLNIVNVSNDSLSLIKIRI